LLTRSISPDFEFIPGSVVFNWCAGLVLIIATLTMFATRDSLVQFKQQEFGAAQFLGAFFSLLLGGLAVNSGFSIAEEYSIGPIVRAEGLRYPKDRSILLAGGFFWIGWVGAMMACGLLGFWSVSVVATLVLMVLILEFRTKSWLFIAARTTQDQWPSIDMLLEAYTTELAGLRSGRIGLLDQWESVSLERQA